MNNVEINVNGKTIKLYGNTSTIEKEKPIIESLGLTGNEYEDRLLIQKCIDDNKLKSDILYDGNTVYPYERIVKSYRKMQKTGSLEKLSKEMYHFFIYACGDIAHYDIGGFKGYYNYSFRELEEQLLKNCWTSSRFTDIDKIFKELKIGRDYYYTRESINIDEVTLKKLKSIIKECGWNIIAKGNYWRIERNTQYDNKFAFEVDISSKSVLDVVQGIQNYYNIFDKNEYIEKNVERRKEDPNSLSIREIVAESDNISAMLSNLSNDVLYKTRLEVEEEKDKLNFNNTDNNKNYDYDY